MQKQLKMMKRMMSMMFENELIQAQELQALVEESWGTFEASAAVHATETVVYADLNWCHHSTALHSLQNEVFVDARQEQMMMGLDLQNSLPTHEKRITQTMMQEIMTRETAEPQDILTSQDKNLGVRIMAE